MMHYFVMFFIIFLAIGIFATLDWGDALGGFMLGFSCMCLIFAVWAILSMVLSCSSGTTTPVLVKETNIILDKNTNSYVQYNVSDGKYYLIQEENIQSSSYYKSDIELENGNKNTITQYKNVPNNKVLGYIFLIDKEDTYIINTKLDDIKVIK